MTAWSITYVALWVLVVLLAVALVGLYRQTGLLLLRTYPKGSFMAAGDGPPVGTEIEKVVLTDIEGKLHRVGDEAEAMLVFVSPGCGACERLGDALRTFSREVRALVLSIGTEMDARAYGSKHGGLIMISDPGLATRYGVIYPPFAMRIDSRGRVCAKGLVNTLEQLERLEDSAMLVSRELEMERKTSELSEVLAEHQGAPGSAGNGFVIGALPGEVKT